MVLAPSLMALACIPPPGDQGQAATAGTDPAELCKRSRELAEKAGEPAEVATQIEQDCVARATEVRGAYAKLETCFAGAGDLRQLRACEQPLASYSSMFAALAPSPEALCDHLIGMMMTELGDQVPANQAPMIRDKCVQETKAKVEELGSEFAAQARCIMSKTTLAGISECDTRPPSERGPAPGGPPPSPPAKPVAPPLAPPPELGEPAGVQPPPAEPVAQP